jgi:hypothetical protein
MSNKSDLFDKNDNKNNLVSKKVKAGEYDVFVGNRKFVIRRTDVDNDDDYRDVPQWHLFEELEYGSLEYWNTFQFKGDAMYAITEEIKNDIVSPLVAEDFNATEVKRIKGTKNVYCVIYRCEKEYYNQTIPFWERMDKALERIKRPVVYCKPDQFEAEGTHDIVSVYIIRFKY